MNPVFVVAGTLGGPDFEGIRLGHFNRKEGGLVVEVAIPKEIVDAKNLRDPIVSSLQMANAAAFHFFEEKGVDFNLRGAEDLVSIVGEELVDFL